MTVNVGTFDRAFRAILGAFLLLAPFLSGMSLFASTFATVISVILGIVLLATAAMKFCPLYSLIGIRTCRP